MAPPPKGKSPPPPGSPSSASSSGSSSSTAAPRPASSPAEIRTADRLHSAAIHLLRRLRVVDRETGLSGPRLSALSVVVFGGPVTVSELAAAEQVSAATVSRMTKEMEGDGLLERIPDPDDGRVQRIRVTGRGRRILEEGRRARVGVLAARIGALEPEDRELLDRAVEILEGLVLPPAHPERAPQG
ncbi:MAG: MarR family transcriptional regulator [Gemmatimonadetes bacterium]|nr:MarR family transcriptional regulator [Gemmatimonadota bacterium]NIR77144.1 MarR family transcriptional regulator [Gemmatimonadota bacterium]NIT85659.1 MarR family transcriptional regulator [Gemmatimonadota bacterium]NIU29491.1 MarR family transcriptional regulator [Gemmatimonadota bacterium]NIU34545.1 MarR family transcriptional regulator [Gemmatimonadota bacterium]